MGRPDRPRGQPPHENGGFGPDFHSSAGTAPALVAHIARSETGPTEELPMRRLLTALALLVVVSAFVAPSHAAAQQSLNVYLGGFSPSPEDARSRSGGRSDDVLVNNLNFLSFDIKEFSHVTLGGEWLVGLGERFDAGIGLGIYSKSVPSVYADLVNEDLSEIE